MQAGYFLHHLLVSILPLLLRDTPTPRGFFLHLHSLPIASALCLSFLPPYNIPGS